MLNLPRFSTKATDELCAEIAKKSHGTVFLMCSRGKDSLCAWLQLRKYFNRIIPFHCATVPGYQFADEYLDYLEYMFDTRILRKVELHPQVVEYVQLGEVLVGDDRIYHVALPRRVLVYVTHQCHLEVFAHHPKYPRVEHVL